MLPAGDGNDGKPDGLNQLGRQTDFGILIGAAGEVKGLVAALRVDEQEGCRGFAAGFEGQALRRDLFSLQQGRHAQPGFIVTQNQGGSGRHTQPGQTDGNVAGTAAGSRQRDARWIKDDAGFTHLRSAVNPQNAVKTGVAADQHLRESHAEILFFRMTFWSEMPVNVSTTIR